MLVNNTNYQALFFYHKFKYYNFTQYFFLLLYQIYKKQNDKNNYLEY